MSRRWFKIWKEEVWYSQKKPFGVFKTPSLSSEGAIIAQGSSEN
jgi:hypothetical protein